MNARILTMASLALLAACSSSSSPTASGPGSPTNMCPASTGPGTKHDPTIGTETWTAADSPHLLSSDADLVGTLTLEPCAEVLIAGGKTLEIRDAGNLVAHGEATKPIHIGAQDPSKPFAQIHRTDGTIDLAYVTIDGGGDPLNALPYLTGTLDLQGVDETKPTEQTIKIDHVTIEGSRSNGIVLRDGAGFFADATDLTVHGAAFYPVSIWARASSTLPPGTYTGNVHDEILLPADHAYSDFMESTTLHERGVPYHVGHDTSAGELHVDAGANNPAATLTIEPGVTMRFKRGGVLRVTAEVGTNPPSGILVAMGTADKPIVFTSAADTPAAGDWLGLTFGQIPSAANAIDHARIDYAGGATTVGSDSCVVAPESRNDAAVRVFGEVTPFITNTAITNSASDGIDRGFRADLKSTFLATNTLTNIALCNESYPRDANGMCPVDVPCPK